MGLWDRLKKGLTGGGASPELAFLRMTREVAEGIEGVTSAVEEPNDLAVRLGVRGGGDSSRLFVINMFHEFGALPPAAQRARMAAILEDLVARQLEPPLEWATARERLVPVLRACTTHGGGGSRILKRPFAPFVDCGVVIDSAQTMRYVIGSALEQWNIDAGVLFDAATANLASAADGLERLETASLPGALWYVATNDDYETSRLVLPGWLAGMKGRVGGRPVAIIPDRTTLVVGRDELAIIEWMHHTAEEKYAAAVRFLSPVVYTVDDTGTVVPLRLNRDHALSSALQLAELRLAGREYNEQKRQLDEQHAKDGTDIFVATFSVMKDKQGLAQSFCTWAEPVDTLLPVSDVVGLAGGDLNDKASMWSLFVPWTDCVRIAGSCLALDSTYHPPRYRTTSWLDKEQLSQMRQVGTALR